MPPPEQGAALTDKELESLKRWIEGGCGSARGIDATAAH